MVGTNAFLQRLGVSTDDTNVNLKQLIRNYTKLHFCKIPCYWIWIQESQVGADSCGS
jgi:hypothetical protein